MHKKVNSKVGVPPMKLLPHFIELVLLSVKSMIDLSVCWKFFGEIW